MSKLIEQFWYKPNGLLRFLFLPFHFLLRLLVQSRFWLYRFRILKSYQPDLPVIVVGNISVGGTGKTPFVIWLSEQLKTQGFEPVVLSRGYGATPPSLPYAVTEDSPTNESGDEPKMMAIAGCKVIVDPDRTRGAKWIEQHFPNSIIICDDGLQHYKLARDIEVCLIDGYRGLGNRLLMPFGPLREPKSRIKYCDLTVQNSGKPQSLPLMTIRAESLVNLKTAEKIILNEQQPFPFEKVTAVCGIGNPMKLRHTLSELGAEPNIFGFPDHHKFVPDDLIQLGPEQIVMTEKDAVKCVDFAQENWWYLKVAAEVDDTVINKIVERLKNLT